MKEIIRGTTPSFFYELPEELNVSQVTTAVMILKNAGHVTEIPWARLIRSPEANAIGHTFTQAETLALRAGTPLLISLTCMAGEVRVNTERQHRLNVIDTDKNEIMEANGDGS